MHDIMPTLTVGDFDRGRINNESLPKLLVGAMNVDKLEWRRDFSNINQKECGGGIRECLIKTILTVLQRTLST